MRNPHYRPSGVNVEVDNDQTTWPAHATRRQPRLPPGRPAAGRLPAVEVHRRVRPVVYRGGLLPEEFDGNAFIGEVTANFVRRAMLTESDGTTRRQQRVRGGADEFLTTTYERFRPVNLYNGPDGALYVVDMHHGLIQHSEYLTPYCASSTSSASSTSYLLHRPHLPHRARQRPRSRPRRS